MTVPHYINHPNFNLSLFNLQKKFNSLRCINILHFNCDLFKYSKRALSLALNSENKYFKSAQTDIYYLKKKFILKSRMCFNAKINREK